VELWSWLAFSGVLLAAATGLIVWHVRVWRQVQAMEPPPEPGELDYHRRQFRRRMQTSGMLAVLAVAILGGRWITVPPLPVWVFAAYWAAITLMALWVGLLALADVVATRLFYGRLRDTYRVEEARLRYQLRRLQEETESEAGEVDANSPPDGGRIKGNGAPNR
jgi:hypothetical protein